jgi:hypothetical protein
MFGCCCGGTELSAYWALTLAGYARWAGFCPFVVTDGTSVGDSLGGKPKELTTKPLRQTLYRTSTVRYEVTSGYESYWSGESWMQSVSKVHPQMGDIYYYRYTSSLGTSDVSYDLNDDGSSSGTNGYANPDASGASKPPRVTHPLQPSVGLYFQSCTETLATWHVKLSGTIVMCVITVTLSDPIDLVDIWDESKTLLQTVDLATPGSDYTPGGAVNYTIDGVTKILCPVPSEYEGTANESYYFQLKNPVNSKDWVIKIAYTRTGGGIGTVNTSVNTNSTLTQLDAPLIQSVRAVFDLPSIYNDGRLISPVGFVTTAAKMLADGTAHRRNDAGVHTGSEVEDASAWGGWTFGTFAEKSSFTSKLAGIVPPEQYEVTSFFGPSEFVTWLPYYIVAVPEADFMSPSLLPDPMYPSSSQTARAASILASLL